MQRAVILGILALATLAQAASAKENSRAPTLTSETINAAQWEPGSKPSGKLSPLILKAQVLLSRAKFSPGVIDARRGENFEKALRAFQAVHGLQTTGTLDESTWKALSGISQDDAVRSYTISKADVKGPFVERIPKDFREMAQFDYLAYRSPRELIAEKFRMSGDLLSALNQRTDFDEPDIEIVVANVAPFEIPRSSGKSGNGASGNVGQRGSSTRLEVNKSERAVRLFDDSDRLIAYFPASIGSPEKPAPSGELEVAKITYNPHYRYNPEYAFKGQKASEPVTIAPGPNGPVGLVWIGLSEESYGIHGTPEPERISKTESNGCIRLTNWDAVALAGHVAKGTKVTFLEKR
jgi:lipoprotein-anchoring transpeptidase ErfK/SrfK